MKNCILRAGAVFGICIIVGCMTLEEQLNSSDPNVRANAERHLEGVVLKTNSFDGGASREERIAAIKLIKDQDVLLRILNTDLNDGRFNGSYWDREFKTKEDVYGPAIDGLDQAHLKDFILTYQDYEDKDRVGYGSKRRVSSTNASEDGDVEASSAISFMRYADNSTRHCRIDNRLAYALLRVQDPIVLAEIFEKTDRNEVKFILFPKVIDNCSAVKNKYAIIALLSVVCKRQNVQIDRGESKKKKFQMPKQKDCTVSEKQISEMVTRIKDQKLYYAMLQPDSKWFVPDTRVLAMVASMLPENRIMDMARKALRDHSIRRWNRKDIVSFMVVCAAVRRSSDIAKSEELVQMMVSKIEDYKNTCMNSMNMSWGHGDRHQVHAIVDAWGDTLPEAARNRLNSL